MNIKSSRFSRGFTLIELLVVISIISMLASVVLAALSSARLKGRAAAVQQETQQLRLWMEQQRLGSGSYSPAFSILSSSGAALNTGTNILYYSFGGSGSSCGIVTADPQFVSLCNAIVNNNNNANNSLIIGGPTTANGASDPIWTNHYLYSIMAQLPNNQAFACVGSSGGNSTNVILSSGNYSASTGCLANP